jgi:hypothetical protein
MVSCFFCSLSEILWPFTKDRFGTAWFFVQPFLASLVFMAQLLVLLAVIACFAIIGIRIELGVKLLALPLVLGVMAESWNGKCATNEPSLYVAATWPH